jgi:hypothetical protein
MKTRECHHGPEEREDGECPFCHRPMRMESHDYFTCAMCGMEVHHPQEAVSMESNGQTLYFCCIWCMRIYLREVTRAAHDYVEEASRRARAKRQGSGTTAGRSTGWDP